MSEKNFYDIHCHTMNLSHPFLGAFLKRIPSHSYLTALSLPGAPLIASKVFSKEIERVTNLFSIMENDIGSMLLLVEEYIKNDENLYDKDKKELKIGNNRYKNLILTPLIMDFGYHHIKPSNGFYEKRPSRKPVANQAYDMLSGIKAYNKISETKLFEVYPFMGINTKNYPLETISDKNSIHKMLDKYFKDYKGSKNDLHNNFGMFDGLIDASVISNFFAGIKVYPPLGFDPWPENDEDELEKVKYLYNYCCEKRIPITTHCSDGGFRVIDDDLVLEYTNPLKWEKVLEEYPKLKLNLAHFGEQSKPFDVEWENTVLRLISNYEYVFADFAYRGVDASYYDCLINLLNDQDEEERDKLKRRILFGSDFMVNLLSCDSYNDYLEKYSMSELSDKLKDQFGSVNPERFLFNEAPHGDSSW